MEQNSHDAPQPFIPASIALPEFTIKGILLAIILTIVLVCCECLPWIESRFYSFCFYSSSGYFYGSITVF